MTKYYENNSKALWNHKAAMIIRAERKRLGWSQQDLAAAAGVSIGYVRSVEGGFGPRRVSAPKYDCILAALAFDRIDVGFRWTGYNDPDGASVWTCSWGPEGRPDVPGVFALSARFEAKAGNSA
jgi:transcriptional regulator with XRE-family HTH domain